MAYMGFDVTNQLDIRAQKEAPVNAIHQTEQAKDED